MQMDRSVAATKKSEETRLRILEAALSLFGERGFEETTMRDIAKKAGVALGAAYYYFDSKDAIVMGFYERSQEQWIPLAEEALAHARRMKERLAAVIEVKFRYFAPYRRLLGALSAHIDPQHSLSPFGDQTQSIRNSDIAFMSRALEGPKVRVTEDLKPYLPRLLWLYQMGLILFWVYDRSPQQKRTQLLFERSLSIVVGLIRLSGFPLLRPVRKLATELLETIYEDEEVPAGVPV